MNGASVVVQVVFLRLVLPSNCVLEGENLK